MLNRGKSSKTVQCRVWPARSSGTSEIGKANRVAAAKKEQASRRLGRLPVAMTKPAPVRGASTAKRSLISLTTCMALAFEFGESAGINRPIVAIHRDYNA